MQCRSHATPIGVEFVPHPPNRSSAMPPTRMPCSDRHARDQAGRARRWLAEMADMFVNAPKPDGGCMVADGAGSARGRRSDAGALSLDVTG